MNWIRKLNVFVLIAIAVLFFIHALLASLSAFGYFTDFGINFSRAGFYLLFVHVFLVGLRTMQLLVPEFQSGEAFKKAMAEDGGWKEAIIKRLVRADLRNQLKKQKADFWVSRLTGLSLLAFVFLHKIWIGRGASIDSGLLYLVISLQILFIIALFLHIMGNLRFLLLKMGIKSSKGLVYTINIILIAGMVFLVRGMLYYYFQK